MKVVRDWASLHPLPIVEIRFLLCGVEVAVTRHTELPVELSRCVDP